MEEEKVMADNPDFISDADMAKFNATTPDFISDADMNKPSRTGEGTSDSPYKLSGEVNVPEEKGLGYGVIEDTLAGGLAAPIVNKGVSAVARLFAGSNQAAKQGVRGIEKIADDVVAGRRYNKNPTPEIKYPPGNISEEVVSRASQNAPNVGSNTLFSLAKLESLFQKAIGANTPHSKELAAQANSLMRSGYTADDALALTLQAWRKRASYLKTPNTKTVGSAIGMLLGSERGKESNVSKLGL